MDINLINSRKERAGKSVKPGAALVLDGKAHRVIKITQGKRGKGGGFVRATLKCLESPAMFEKTFTSDEMVEHADLERVDATFSWIDGNEVVFMNQESYEEIRILKDEVDDLKYLVDGLTVKLMRFGDKFIGVELPIVNEYTVVTLGNVMSTNGSVQATLNSGAIVNVPQFIKEGDRIRVNIEGGNYVDRA